MYLSAAALSYCRNGYGRFIFDAKPLVCHAVKSNFVCRRMKQLMVTS